MRGAVDGVERRLSLDRTLLGRVESGPGIAPTLLDPVEGRLKEPRSALDAVEGR